MSMTELNRIMLAIPLLAILPGVMAATPPERVNYQGVLRDAAGNPQDGSFDMVFRFFDAVSGGNELLVDEHLAAGTGAVVVTNGLFSAELGGGSVSVGSGSGAVATLGELFAGFTDLSLEIQVEAEILSPRVPILSAGYALNAGTLAGRPATEFLDTSVDPQTKAGDLTLGSDLEVADRVSAVRYSLDSAGQRLGQLSSLVLVGSVPGPFLTAEPPFSAYLWLPPQDDLEIQSGTGHYWFFGTDSVLAELDNSGNLSVNGDLSTANDLSVGSGITLPFAARISSDTDTLYLQAGQSDLDDLLLSAGNSVDDGRITIAGQEAITFEPGNGECVFMGSTGITATLDDTGNLSVVGDLSSGGVLALPFSAEIRGNTDSMWLLAGDEDFDDFHFFAGNSTDDGRMSIEGRGAITLEPFNGQIIFNRMGWPSTQLTITNPIPNVNEWDSGGAGLQLYLGDSADDAVVLPGSLSVAGAKNFVQNHPEDERLSVVYTALEGDEAGTYTRGSARLSGGVAHVPLGESYRWVTNPDVGLTAHVTPRGEWADLYVESVSTSELVVRSREGGSLDAAFDYLVQGLRLGYEESSVVQDRRVDATVPSPASNEEVYKLSPERRPLNALYRFRAMHADVWGVEPIESAATIALRAGIGMHDHGAVPALTPEPHAASGRAGEIAPDATRRSAPAAEAQQVPPPGFARISPGVTSDPVPAPHPQAASELTTVFRILGAADPGDLLVVDPDHAGALRRADRQADSSVVGIVTSESARYANGSEDAAGIGVEDDPDGSSNYARVAFAGVVMLNVDAVYGSVRPGDLLMSSPTPGHAMRMIEPTAGAIVGKALREVAAGTARIPVLVTLR